jgi:hypothetical protein
MAGDSQDPHFGYWKISRHGKIEMFWEVRKVFVEVQSCFLCCCLKGSAVTLLPDKAFRAREKPSSRALDPYLARRGN